MSIKKAIWLALPISFFYFLIGLYHLWISHPHEDAYILYKYAENLASGHGIVYHIGGVHAEGATDFLWLLILSFINLFGVDIAIASLIANSLGALLAGAIFLRLVDSMRIQWWYFYIAASIFILLLPQATAGYVGFSTMLYSAIILLNFAIFISTKQTYYVYIPIISIVIGLMRPDGVIIGVCFTVLAYCYVHKDRAMKYLLQVCIAAIIGIVYFIWRYMYFGHLLPLPLYVKSNGGMWLAGLGSNAAWLMSIQAVLIVMCLIWLNKHHFNLDLKKISLGLLPVCTLIFILTFVHQSQNVDFRFQSAFSLLISYVLCMLIIQINTQKTMQKIIIILLAILILPFNSYLYIARITLDRFQTNYNDVFPNNIRNYVDLDTKIALTEAGRTAYWVNAEIVDLVGLNTPFTAKNIPTTRYLTSFEPDIIMLHHSNTFDTSNINQDGNVIEITQENIRSRVKSAYEFLLDDHLQSYDEVTEAHTTIAAVKAIQYISDHQDQYRTFIVKYLGEYDHIFAIRNDYPYSTHIIDELYQATELSEIPSYLQMKLNR